MPGNAVASGNRQPSFHQACLNHSAHVEWRSPQHTATLYIAIIPAHHTPIDPEQACPLRNAFARLGVRHPRKAVPR
jgi:hypothetical protein